MRSVWSFFRREPILLIAALAAAVSCVFVPIDRAYLGYFDLRTLALLFSLMLVVAGLRAAGAFELLGNALCKRAANTRALALLLVALTFFSSLLVTNDVALLTFVPFAAILFEMTGKRDALPFLVALQTAAANLGSMLTPVGSPQNLYLYSYYDLSAIDFFRITLPAWLLSLVLVHALCLLVPRASVRADLGDAPRCDKRRLWLYLALFAVCLLSVFRALPWGVMLVLVAASALFFDRARFAAVDYPLLLTFAAFFVFAGNLTRIDAVSALLRRMLAGREYLTALLASQVISNVPAALLLAGFTDRARSLLLGVDLGALGTPIASLASLISLKLYSRTTGAKTGRFLLYFTAVNLSLLAILTAALAALS